MSWMALILVTNHPPKYGVQYGNVSKIDSKKKLCIHLLIVSGLFGSLLECVFWTFLAGANHRTLPQLGSGMPPPVFQCRAHGGIRNVLDPQDQIGILCI